MSDYFITSRMCAWAKRSLMGIDGGIGFKRQVSFVNNMPAGVAVDYTPDVDEAFIEMDLCVVALSIERPELYQVIYLHYLRGDLKVDGKVSMLGCSKQTFYNKVSLAHQLLLGWLNDLAAGIQIPSRAN
jgi:hypothetical protein